ncbi:MAG TPA: DNA polymerase III subunit beta [Acidobacteriota bacterium]|nr:DNA polymerase III subunit beta [Acidobacteriota bacterium]
MDLVVKRSDFLKELQYVQGVVERKTTVPILSNLLLETAGNSLVVTATDLDVTIQCGCGAAVKVSGAVTVSARKLFDIVRLLPDSDVHFKATSADWMSVTCERSRFKLATLSKENFPEIPNVTNATMTLPASALRYMITRCTFAITQEESRYSLNGALMILRPDGITFVTTDGHRLVYISRETTIEGIEGGEVRTVVPKKTLTELSKLTAEDILNVQFGISENHLFFRVGERLLVSRVMTGQFPNYEMVIPRDNHRRAILNTLDFVDALKRTSVMADEQSHGLRLIFQEGQLEVASASTDFGEARESLPIEFAGEPLEIGFNAFYLLDFLNGLESEQVVFELRDQDTQGLLKPKMSEDYTYQYVVMPMRI